jgi:hypothetical protein
LESTTKNAQKEKGEDHMIQICLHLTGINLPKAVESRTMRVNVAPSSLPLKPAIFRILATIKCKEYIRRRKQEKDQFKAQIQCSLCQA